MAGVSPSSLWFRPFLLVVCAFLAHGPLIQAARFLLPATSLASTRSHYMGLSTISRELVLRGHEVTFLLLDRRGTAGMLEGSYTDNITYPNSKSDEELAAALQDMLSTMESYSDLTISQIVKKMGDLYSHMNFGCYELFRHEETLQKLKMKKFDMVLSSPVIEACDSLISAYLNVSLTIVTGTRRTPTFNEDIFGIPVPSSYTPYSFAVSLPSNMNFWQRVVNYVLRYTIHPLTEYFTITLPIGRLQEMYDIRRDLSPKQLLQRADLWLCHTTFALDSARPITPNWVPVAGYSIKLAKPLPQKLEAFIEGSGEDGFIIFTLGSMVASISDKSVTNAIAKVFSELKQRVVWRYVGPTPANLGNNTLISDWLPQSDLLGHPRARLLIYHGGSAGVHEALYFGVPMVIMPLFGDQPANAAAVADRELGVVIDRSTITEDKFRKAVRQVLDDPRFKTNAAKASAIFQDDLMKPLDRAIFWIEHVIKFGGAHLRTRANDLNFITRNCLDVLAVIITSVLLMMYVFVRFFMLLTRCCCARNRGQKVKAD
ncbi:UDP-glucuronosyltransferase 2C1-like [Diadema antillarum]|uniref:UDP-glucuronosyltransferase 2C1-like n=1 Tax=Diadema antillarum TaxID=105358 RepID=UPI003A88A1EF